MLGSRRRKSVSLLAPVIFEMPFYLSKCILVCFRLFPNDQNLVSGIVVPLCGTNYKDDLLIGGLSFRKPRWMGMQEEAERMQMRLGQLRKRESEPPD